MTLLPPILVSGVFSTATYCPYMTSIGFEDLPFVLTVTSSFALFFQKLSPVPCAPPSQTLTPLSPLHRFNISILPPPLQYSFIPLFGVILNCYALRNNPMSTAGPPIGRVICSITSLFSPFFPPAASDSIHNLASCYLCSSQPTSLM